MLTRVADNMLLYVDYRWWIESSNYCFRQILHGAANGFEKSMITIEQIVLYLYCGTNSNYQGVLWLIDFLSIPQLNKVKTELRVR